MNRTLTLLVGTVAVVLTLGAGRGQAEITPLIPGDLPPAPPPLVGFPGAGESPPPADVISDPATPGATCSGWYRQNAYAGRWNTASTWWEYSCHYQWPQCNGQCNMDWGPAYYRDFFVWDGFKAVVYGQLFEDTYWDSMYAGTFCTYWWDQSALQWFILDTPACPYAGPGNAAPTASFYADCSELSCSFHAGSSWASDGIVAYSWDFGDGTSGSGMDASHTYPGKGEYKAILQVTDAGGLTAVASRQLTILNDAPVARFTVNCSALSCSFDGTASTDDDGAIRNYYWYFGDGGSASGSTAQHTYFHSGNYTVTLIVQDDLQASGSASQTLALGAPNVGPMSNFTFVCSGGTCQFDGSGSSDSDGTIVLHAWTFGDGTNGSGATIPHAYAASGTYTASLTVTDDDGASAAASKDVTVTIPPPNIAPTAAFTVRCSGLVCTVDAGASSDDGSIVSYRWDFGDGATGSGSIAEHVYAQPRAYTVMLTVTDDRGATAATAKTFNPISVSARGYKQNGLQKVDLTWTGSSASGFDLFRNGTRIATVQGTAYTDNIDKKGAGTYTYEVCAASTSVCSTDTTVTF